MSDELASLPTENKVEHYTTIRIVTDEMPDLKKIAGIAAKLGTIRQISYDNY